MNKIFFTLILLIALGFVSCETDIDVNAEPTDVTIVFGLLDPIDSVHYLKINKAFIGEGSALDLAANSNNYNYTDAEINVSIEGNGTSYPLTRVTNEIPKDAGIFDNTTNVLYRFEAPINIANSYTLKIINTSLDKEVTATTNIVGETSVSVAKTLGLWIGDVSTGNAGTEPISASIGANIGRIQAFVIFNYMEYYTNSTIGVPKNVRLNLGEEKANGSSNGQVTFTLKGQAFIDNIIANVSDPSTIANFSHRELDNISIELSTAEIELSTYMEAEAPSTTVNQDKPSYTNIDNGIGIFSSRSKHFWFSTKTASTGLNMDADTKRYLASLGLGFCLGTNTTATNPCPF